MISSSSLSSFLCLLFYAGIGWTVSLPVQCLAICCISLYFLLWDSTIRDQSTPPLPLRFSLFFFHNFIQFRSPNTSLPIHYPYTWHVYNNSVTYLSHCIKFLFYPDNLCVYLHMYTRIMFIKFTHTLVYTSSFISHFTVVA